MHRHWRHDPYERRDWPHGSSGGDQPSLLRRAKPCAASQWPDLTEARPAYRGVNVVLLWGEAAARGFQSSTWMTFRQALALGAHVRKGEKGSTVVYADQLVRIDDDDAGEETTRRIPFLKAYTVFNVEQIEGLPASSAPAPAPVLNLGQRIARAETFFAATGADVRHGGGCAFYAPGPDFVQMPVFESFRDPERPAPMTRDQALRQGREARRDAGRTRDR